MLRQLLLSLLLTVLPASAQATGISVPHDQPTRAAAGQSAVRQDALELARLLNPPEPIIALAGRSFDNAFDKAMAADGGGEALEEAYPGMVAALRDAVRETTLASLRADMPSTHERYARLFAGSFTADEVAELLRFYRSPTGRKIIDAKFANLDVSALTDRFVQDPDAKLTAGDVKAANAGVMSGVFKEMTAEDVKALMSFGLSPVGKKLKDIAPQVAEIEADIANAPDPQLDAEIEAATQKVYERFGVKQTAAGQ